MVAGLESMRNKEAADNEMRKEDSKNRVAHDKNDRENIWSNLERSSIHVFDFIHHPETWLINIPTRKMISDSTANVE